MNVPRGRKQMLPDQLRVEPKISENSLLVCSTGLGSHRSAKVQDQVDFLIGGGQNSIAEEQMCWEALWLSLVGNKNFCQSLPPPFCFSQGFATVCGKLLKEVIEAVAFSPQMSQSWR